MISSSAVMILITNCHIRGKETQLPLSLIAVRYSKHILTLCHNTSVGDSVSNIFINTNEFLSRDKSGHASVAITFSYYDLQSECKLTFEKNFIQSILCVFFHDKDSTLAIKIQ